MQKRKTVLSILFMLTVFAAMYLISQDVILHNKEIVSLKQRIRNLEIVINHDFQITLEKPADKENKDDNVI